MCIFTLINIFLNTFWHESFQEIKKTSRFFSLFYFYLFLLISPLGQQNDKTIFFHNKGLKSHTNKYVWETDKEAVKGANRPITIHHPAADDVLLRPSPPAAPRGFSDWCWSSSFRCPLNTWRLPRLWLVTLASCWRVREETGSAPSFPEGLHWSIWSQLIQMDSWYTRTHTCTRACTHTHTLQSTLRSLHIWFPPLAGD